jgi:hypothetical protein
MDTSGGIIPDSVPLPLGRIVKSPAAAQSDGFTLMLSILDKGGPGRIASRNSKKWSPFAHISTSLPRFFTHPFIPYFLAVA